MKKLNSFAFLLLWNSKDFQSRFELASRKCFLEPGIGVSWLYFKRTNYHFLTTGLCVMKITFQPGVRAFANVYQPGSTLYFP